MRLDSLGIPFDIRMAVDVKKKSRCLCGSNKSPNFGVLVKRLYAITLFYVAQPEGLELFSRENVYARPNSMPLCVRCVYELPPERRIYELFCNGVTSRLNTHKYMFGIA